MYPAGIPPVNSLATWATNVSVSVLAVVPLKLYVLSAVLCGCSRDNHGLQLLLHTCYSIYTMSSLLVHRMVLPVYGLSVMHRSAG